MRINPKQLLQGLLYLTPITLLALASCGGGGGGSNVTLGSAYSLYVSVIGISGVTGTGLVLHNGGDDLTFTAPGTKAFANQVLSGTTYNISVISQPVATPTQVCTIAGPTGPMPASAKTVAVSCVTGFTISGTVTGGSGNVVLQNNSDNLVVNSNGGTFSFTVASGSKYDVTVLTNPPGYQCTSSISGSSIGVNLTGQSITCSALPATPTPDKHAYVANTNSNSVWAYTLSAGVPTGHTVSSTGTNKPSAITVFGGKYAFVVNGSTNNVWAYKVTSGVLSTSPVSTTTGNGPAAIAVHPSGKFAYVVNQLSNNISAYSINPTTGALASIDADAGTAGMQATISTGTAFIPVAIAIDPAGTYAFVASLGNSSYITSCGGVTATGCITAYQIDAATGALTSVPIASGGGKYAATGSTPSSIAVDSAKVYVTNQADSTVYAYTITTGGELVTPATPVPGAAGTYPTSIALNPRYDYAYVTEANTTTGDVRVFRRSTLGTFGALKSTGGANPASISVDSTGQYAYVANSGSNSITVFNISGSGSAVSSVSCTSNCASDGNFTAGTYPVSVTTSP